MNKYTWLSLSEVAKYEPEMRRLKVSIVARSPRGFLTMFKRANGKPLNMDFFWWRKRDGFIARHLAQYRVNPTYRRWLALVAWSYKPDNRFGKVL